MSSKTKDPPLVGKIFGKKRKCVSVYGADARATASDTIDPSLNLAMGNILAARSVNWIGKAKVRKNWPE